MNERRPIRICASAASCCRINDRFLGEFDVPGFTLRFSQLPPRPLRDAPTLGEDNQLVLREYLVIRRDRSAV